MTSGRLDWPYALDRLRAGVAHQNIGLEPRWYMGAYGRYLAEVIPLVGEVMEPDTTSRTTSALVKMALLDLGLALDTYTHADHQAMEHMARHDALTGLPNRNFLLQILAERIERDVPFALFFIGLERFQTINETLGHRVGDEILAEVAGRLRPSVRTGAFFSRLSGAAFAILPPAPCDAEAAARIVREKLDLLTPAYDLGDFSVDVDVSIGVAMYPVHGRDPHLLMQRAQTALEGAKRTQHLYSFYRPSLERTTVEHLALLGDLRRGIEDDQLLLHYQPKVDLHTGETVGLEALLRWEHPVHGLMQPAQFVRAAEQTSLIHGITSSVLRQATRQMAGWRERGFEPTVSLNLAARNLQDTNLPDEVETELERTGLEPSRLMFEITESEIMADRVRAVRTLRRLRDLGVKTSLDDFGTGYSSLMYLKELPADEIKIDRMFVANLVNDSRDEQIAFSTVELGHALGLTVTAEGIEDEETRDRLREGGCDLAQGFLFCKPLGPRDLERWMGIG